MAEVPNDLTTTVSVDAGEVYEGTIETAGDEDWIAVDLTAGVTYGFSQQGLPSGSGTLVDPYIKGLYDSEGNSLGLEDDDSGQGRESLLVFTPETSGTYYVSVSSWVGNVAGYDPTGTYSFSYGLFESVSSTPTSDAFVEHIDASGDQFVDSLLSLSRYKNVTGEETLTVTYSLANANSVFSEDPEFGYGAPSSDAAPWAGVSALTSSEAALFEGALAQVSSFSGIAFQKVEDNAESAGTIRIAWTAQSDEDGAAWAYLPSSSAVAGDIWLLSENLNTGGEGSFFQSVILHEVGHAVGLKHPFENDGSGVILPTKYDGLEYTVMSYNASVDGTYIQSLNFYPTTFMYYDILALQYMYGAIEKDAGNTTYSFALGTRYYETIWDTGGIDTFDASAQTKNLKLDLTPGSWSNVGTTVFMYGFSQTYDKTDTVFIPPEVTIEKAFGGSGNDEIIGNAASNVLAGNGGDDYLTGAAGADTLRGNAGDDTVYGGGGNDVIWAGAGDLGADLIDGGDGNDIIGGGAGNDVVYGAEGADIIFGGGGEDTLYGGDGATAAETANNQIWSGAGDDIVYGAEGNDALGGGDGNDNISGNGGDDILYAGPTGADTLDGGAGDDIVFGGSENDSVSGGAGSDELYGGAGDDVVSGGADADTLYGGAGDDTLTGGAGDDTLRGGGGADTFVFASGDGDDRVEGFTVGEDILDLVATATDFTDLASVQAAASESADGLLINLGGGDSILLAGLALSDLDSMTLLLG